LLEMKLLNMVIDPPKREPYYCLNVDPINKFIPKIGAFRRLELSGKLENRDYYFDVMSESDILEKMSKEDLIREELMQIKQQEKDLERDKEMEELMRRREEGRKILLEKEKGEKQDQNDNCILL